MAPKVSSLTLLLTLAMAGCGGGEAGEARGPNTVVMEDIQFSPKALTVKAGQTVTWVNEDSVEHNVVAQSDPKLKSPLFGQGKSYAYTAAKAGTVAYVCTVHPGMEGTLTVEE